MTSDQTRGASGSGIVSAASARRVRIDAMWASSLRRARSVAGLAPGGLSWTIRVVSVSASARSNGCVSSSAAASAPTPPGREIDVRPASAEATVDESPATSAAASRILGIELIDPEKPILHGP